tara:strand:- start:254 stop:562 length:309 start_codon:yes stop_codon:yes gene_type:complete
LTQDIGKGLLRTKRNTTEREIKMYVIAHYRFKNISELKTVCKEITKSSKIPWHETWPIDQLVDDDNKILKFETKEEALETLESWGVNLNIAQAEGVRIEMVH